MVSLISPFNRARFWSLRTKPSALSIAKLYLLSFKAEQFVDLTDCTVLQWWLGRGCMHSWNSFEVVIQCHVCRTSCWSSSFDEFSLFIWELTSTVHSVLRLRSVHFHLRDHKSWSQPDAEYRNVSIGLCCSTRIHSPYECPHSVQTGMPQGKCRAHDLIFKNNEVAQWIMIELSSKWTLASELHNFFT